MLLIEWNAWWRAMPGLDAEERLAAYTVGLLSDPGWQMDRDSLLGRWRELAAGAASYALGYLKPNDSPTVSEEDFKPGALRRRSWAVWQWLRSNLGSGVT